MGYEYLGKINCPNDLKQLNTEQLKVLASELRQEITNTVSTNGGHLASNLGIIELTLALHLSFDLPNDSLIFDVGHQCYAHKLITGRFSKFNTLRKKGGLSGFMRPDESEYDAFVTGHSSNSISAACGIAKANTLLGNENYTIAVIGDGALSGGMAFEGLNNAVNNNDKLIVIVNDNKMSISRNVGGLSKHLNKIRTKPSYYKFKRIVDKSLSSIPLIGASLRSSVYNSKLMLKNAIYHSNVFEGIGYDYLGPIDGHNIEKLLQVLSIAKFNKGPVIVHVLTVKGKGYKYAEAMPNNYHGVAPFDVEVGLESNAKTNFSKEFGNTLCELAKNDDKICAITAAMTTGTGLDRFSTEFSNRFFDVGIAEQHAVTFAAGLAKKGFKPYFAVYSSFLQRGFDQIIHDAAVLDLPITLCIDRAGLIGDDGETHQGIFDVSFLSLIPNVKVFSPSTYSELESILIKSTNRTSEIWAIRYPRGSEVELSSLDITNNEFDVFSKNSKTAVISYGITFGNCFKALNDKELDLIKLNQINALNEALINKLEQYGNIYFFEECVLKGSVGEQLSEKLLNSKFSGKFLHYAINDEFVPHATQSEQRKQYCLDSDSIKGIVCGGKK